MVIVPQQKCGEIEMWRWSNRMRPQASAEMGDVAYAAEIYSSVGRLGMIQYWDYCV